MPIQVLAIVHLKGGQTIIKSFAFYFILGFAYVGEDHILVTHFDGNDYVYRKNENVLMKHLHPLLNLNPF